MLLAEAEGMHPMRAVQEYDIIKGKPSLKAKAKLRRFLSTGGKVTWHELSDTCAKATFEHPQGGKATIEWTIERARKAGLYDKRNRDGSPNMWQRFTRQMLRSRVISEGVDTVFPITTLYTPEEVVDMVIEPDKAPTFDAVETFDTEAIVDTSEAKKAEPAENTKPEGQKVAEPKPTPKKPKKQGFFAFLEACQAKKREFKKLGKGNVYYEILNKFHLKHSNEVPKTDRKLQKAVYAALREALEVQQANVAAEELEKQREELKKVAQAEGYGPEALDALARSKLGKERIDALSAKELEELMQFFANIKGPAVDAEPVEDEDEELPY